MFSAVCAVYVLPKCHVRGDKYTGDGFRMKLSGSRLLLLLLLS